MDFLVGGCASGGGCAVWAVLLPSCTHVHSGPSAPLHCTRRSKGLTQVHLRQRGRGRAVPRISGRQALQLRLSAHSLPRTSTSLCAARLLGCRGHTKEAAQGRGQRCAVAVRGLCAARDACAVQQRRRRTGRAWERGGQGLPGGWQAVPSVLSAWTPSSVLPSRPRCRCGASRVRRPLHRMCVPCVHAGRWPMCSPCARLAAPRARVLATLPRISLSVPPSLLPRFHSCPHPTSLPLSQHTHVHT